MTRSSGAMARPTGGDDTIAARLHRVRAQIDAACAQSGRDPSQVRLLPVSKTRPVADLVAAMDAGWRIFAENQVAELVTKAEFLGDQGAEFELIGHLQTNKARDVARWASRFHALDSLKVAGALDRRLSALGRDLEVLIQVNSSGESTKFGLAPDDVPAFARSLAPYGSLRAIGLMTIAAHTQDRRQIAECFASVQRLAERLRDESVLDSAWQELSMGMSGDFELAIAHGATTVRVGRAIFGARH